uniref:Uncharacterized protein n=1 Tax=Knipowitschia caucasica TaxID=637954 RepID=A0AAV2J7V5_KNICA
MDTIFMNMRLKAIHVYRENVRGECPRGAECAEVLIRGSALSAFPSGQSTTLWRQSTSWSLRTQRGIP